MEFASGSSHVSVYRLLAGAANSVEMRADLTFHPVCITP